MRLIDVCNPVEIKSVSQCAFLPFTPVPREFAGKTVRIVIVVEDGVTAAPGPVDQPPEQQTVAALNTTIGDAVRQCSIYLLADETDPNERWRVLYGERGDGWPSTRMSRLCLQIGHKGQAVVVRSVSSPGHIVRPSSPRGTSEAEEVQCSTAGGTMPPNPADCPIGEGSGSPRSGLTDSCDEPVVRPIIEAMHSFLANPNTITGTALLFGEKRLERIDLRRVNFHGDIERVDDPREPGLAVRTLDEIPPLFGVNNTLVRSLGLVDFTELTDRLDADRHLRAALIDHMALPPRMLRRQPREDALFALQRNLDVGLRAVLAREAEVTEMVYERDRRHRECERLWWRIRCYDFAPVPFNPETWTGNWKTCPGLAGDRVP